MSFIKLLVALVVLAAAILFAIGNNVTTTINLGWVKVDIWLPLLVAIAFLIGLLPAWMWLAASRLRVKRKLKRAEALLDRKESELAAARVELLRPPAPAREEGAASPAADEPAAGGGGSPATESPATDSKEGAA